MNPDPAYSRSAAVHLLKYFIFFLWQGLAITFVSEEADAKILNEVQERFEVDITELPEEIDLSTYIEGR
jgi:hypothetical protein